ncbi:MAG: hypothetical protein MUF22_04175, partial [Chitinispirillaceae bacterium]|nr:hypothetical protein [Chitinispirillaceae bacterium]
MPNIRQIINLIASRHLRPQPTALSILVDPLSRGEPVSFARYGDGEWEAILGHGGANCDGHSYTPLLGEALRHSLLHPKNYLYGIQPFACKCLGKKIARFIRENNVSIPWINADILHDANLEGRLLPFINALRKSHCIIIGPQHLRSLRLFPCAHFIEIPAKNCFDKHEQIMDEIRAYSQIR